MEQPKRRVILYVLIICVIIVVPSIVLLERNNSSPFRELRWESQATSNLTSAISSNSTFFFSSYAINETAENETTSIWITAMNVTNGNLLWKSNTIQVYGLDPMVVAALNAPKMWVEEGLLYAVVYNSTNMLEIHNFEIYVFNTTTGKELNHQDLYLGEMNYSVTQLYAPCVLSDNSGMYLSFITQYVPFTGPSAEIYATFHTVYYDIEGSAVKAIWFSNCSVLGTTSWGLGDMQSAEASGYGIFTFALTNQTVVENLTDGSYRIMNSYMDDLSATANGIYASELQNHTVSVLTFDSATGNFTKIFDFSSNLIGGNQGTEYGLHVLSDNRFSFVIQSDFLIPSGLQNSVYSCVTFLGFSSEGVMLWNQSVKADSYGTFSQVNIVGNNEVLLNTHAGAYVNGATYNAEFLLINFQSGTTLWSSSYSYTVSNGNNPLAIFGHRPYLGELVSENGYMVFFIGSQIACSYVYDL